MTRHLAHRRARICSGLARIERTSPVLIEGSRRVPAWRIGGNKWAVAWVFAHARYCAMMAEQGYPVEQREA